MTLVVDSSVVVAALVDGGDEGTWALDLVGSDRLAAPHLMLVETANILRRLSASGIVSADAAGLAHADLLGLSVDLVPYRPVARRVWELRHTVTSYDGWYVAVAEALGAPLATLDRRLARASGPRCQILTT